MQAVIEARPDEVRQALYEDLTAAREASSAKVVDAFTARLNRALGVA